MIDPIAFFTDHIREHAPQYYSEFESTQVKVQLEAKQERTASMLYRFIAYDSSNNHLILVKVPHYRGRQVDSSKDEWYFKPILFPMTEPRYRHRLEYTALKNIYEYFISLNEKSLGAIRVLDYLPEYHAIMVEASHDPPLRQLFLKTSRLHIFSPAYDLNLAFHNVGKWLRLYHEMSKVDNVQIRHVHRSEYINAIVTLTNFLGSTLNDNNFFKMLAATLETSALTILPETLPLGLGHGDFAMRNILVGQNSRVTVIDTFAKWRTPIYEDIGYFLNGLKVSSLQVFSLGLLFNNVKLSAYEFDFLNGYFAQKPIPLPEIRLYEILALLDKWSSIIAHYQRQKKKFQIFGKIRITMTNQYFKKRARNLLREIVESKVSYTPVNSGIVSRTNDV